MAKYIIKGGKKLEGKIEAESAKNAVLPLLAAACLTDEEVIIKNCPPILDVVSMINILKELGVKVRYEGKNLVVNAASMHSFSIPYSLSKELRSSVFMLGALVSRFKSAEASYPGGCDIGLRPIDLHLAGLKQMGVRVGEFGGEIVCKADKLTGGDIYFDFPSVGATENIILAAVLAEGRTVIHNAAKEPEVEDLQNFINSMGGKVAGAGSSVITVDGVKKLHGTEYKPLFDRIEAGTYLVAAAATGGSVEISNCNPEKISALLHKLCDNTCKITLNNDIIYLKSGSIRKSFNIETLPYPGFPTDMQAQMVALAAVSSGISVIRENIFETRFRHVRELNRMGANIVVKDRVAIVSGVKELSGAKVTAHDLRGGAALVVAGLNARGVTIIEDVRHVERGYYKPEEKFRALGADFEKI
ncbi:MAG: UDP-N-acetylglucosamine 1-carboxyvinyltransferase [Eubacteriales bacterium]